MKTLTGVAAAPGVALGSAYVFRPVDLAVPQRRAADPAAEWVRYRSAVAVALLELEAVRLRAVASVGEADAAIFDAHKMFLDDPEIDSELHAELAAGASAEAAVETVFARNAALLEALDDPLFSARSADLRDVGRRVLRCLLGERDESLAAMTSPGIVVAHDLLPSDTAQLNRALVRGFCTAGGGPLAHTAVLARNLGLPAVVGVGEGLLALTAGTPLIVEGSAGVVIAEPDAATQARYAQAAATAHAVRARAEADCLKPALTRDGRRVEVVGNIGLPGEEAEALAAGAEGIGLLRTEFLFVGRTSAPDEAEQYDAYRKIVRSLGSRPLVARTLDIGGDKPAAFLAAPPEDNPFLGWRAIRIGLARPELLTTQLRALLRAGQGGNLKIMFPMVATVEEIQQARALAEAAHAALRVEGVPCAERFEIGTMIEIPSAALLAEHLAQHVDFFSIGSNDLTQYTLAADRGNPAVAALQDGLHPAVLRLIDMVLRAAHARGRWVGLCGELACDPEAVPILLGLGLDEFSMGAAAIPGIKALLRTLSLDEARPLAEAALRQATAGGVRALVREGGYTTSA
jgi:phosphoenolpyruvate-protein phosphotransferase (PTS system enzyme I)